MDVGWFDRACRFDTTWLIWCLVNVECADIFNGPLRVDDFESSGEWCCCCCCWGGCCWCLPDPLGEFLGVGDPDLDPVSSLPWVVWFLAALIECLWAADSISSSESDVSPDSSSTR